jgi:uncharacterized membrane protein YhaH (DUF805 family)
MSVWQMLFSFNGRLNRRPYWIATIAFMAVVITITAGVAGVLYATGDPVAQAEFLRTIHLWLMPLAMLLAYPEAAIFAKRLHDRNKPGALAALFVIPSLVSSWLDPQGSLGGLGNGSLHLVYTAATIMTWVVGIWFTIELGFLRGSTGENRYGADPLAGAEVR